MHHVIVGSGPAGVTAAETIRSIDKTAQITLIGGEGEAPYSRMAIPYLLHGDIEEKGTFLRKQAGHYESLGIDYKNTRIAGIDATTKTLWTTAIEPLKYDRLLLATGATPIIPRFEGSDLPGVHTCWTLADARAITKLVGKGTPVVLVGAGFIGSIVLEALHKTGAQLTVVEIAPRMVARMMDETAGGMLGRWCTEHGVRVLTNTKVERILPGSGTGTSKLSVGLSNGEFIPATLVVLAAGVRSNTGLLAGTGANLLQRTYGGSAPAPPSFERNLAENGEGSGRRLPQDAARGGAGGRGADRQRHSCADGDSTRCRRSFLCPAARRWSPQRFYQRPAVHPFLGHDHRS